MSYQVLARKWRPKRFEEVIGQEHITRSLQNALSRDQIGHAYILTGTRGIGKTTIARMFAKSLRCENRQDDGNPCGHCNSCEDFDSQSSMNVIEIDGASNNSVDDVRDLISNVQYLPTVGKYKVYIIDEVHMLSTNAFNALLKTLEEPPAHAVFILATTEPEKLLGTVLSRCQRFDFRNAALPDLVKHVKHIANVEGISFQNDELIEIICKQGNGSFRDTLSLFDQVLSFCEDNNVTEDRVSLALGIAKISAVKDLVQGILVGDERTVSLKVREIIAENISVKNLLTSVLDYIFELIDSGKMPADVSPAESMWIYETISKDANWVMDSLLPVKSLEIILKKLALRRSFFDGATSSAVIPSIQTEKKTEKIEPIESIKTEVEVLKETTEVQAEVQKEEAPEPIQEERKEIKFDKILEEIEEEKSMSQAEEGPQMDEEAVARFQLSVSAPVLTSDGEKTWEGFLGALGGISPAAASNLEQGNLVSPLHYDGRRVMVELGFSKSGKVFFDYINESESRAKLVDNLKKYFNCEDVSLNIMMVESEEENFISRADIKEMDEEKKLNEKREKILNDPLIVSAQDIFNSKVDKVVIDKK
ncbi:DNA polymerase III, subunit gamma and tau [Bacteriovorax sp. BSW11_IV]|uniref:DNA polymerase III subunit gamma/tau n=1 Tax=Bacteriovorax sp. BSW11_IV TaxID=1353529 RepID=UPI000389E57C|nr:DNA polymerase III subunit gamma/tau [Bacteriovorax sp. BSW11_IV]EQC42891.1 DNA polymerase III, subunit gamma and tau [Bacteriovorax sp. BSW11_IV]